MVRGISIIGTFLYEDKSTMEKYMYTPIDRHNIIKIKREMNSLPSLSILNDISIGVNRRDRVIVEVDAVEGDNASILNIQFPNLDRILNRFIENSNSNDTMEKIKQYLEPSCRECTMFPEFCKHCEYRLEYPICLKTGATFKPKHVLLEDIC